LALEGGILSRVDDMVVVRGVNVFPTAVEEIVRSCPEVTEYQVQISALHAMAELSLKIEVQPGFTGTTELVAKLVSLLQKSLSLRVPVEIAAAGTLPRFEMKGKRWIRT
jgi:phenylacetate-CoA ligase